MSASSSRSKAPTTLIGERTDDMKKGTMQLVQTARSIWEYQNSLRKQQQMKNVFAKNPLRGASSSGEKAGAIDDITALVIVLNPRIDKSQLQIV